MVKEYKMRLLNKKGMDISLNFVILAVLALLALIIIALFFTGGLTALFEDTEEIGNTDGEKIAFYQSECELYCTLDQKASWESVTYKSDSGTTYTCPTLVTTKDFSGDECKSKTTT
jgi:hypothetical protein